MQQHKIYTVSELTKHVLRLLEDNEHLSNVWVRERSPISKNIPAVICTFP